MIKNARPMKTVASIVVIRESISAVLRTPNIVPNPALVPPKLPARPPPLLDCIRTTAIRRMAIIISKTTKNVYNFSPQFCIKFILFGLEMQLRKSSSLMVITRHQLVEMLKNPVELSLRAVSPRSPASRDPVERDNLIFTLEKEIATSLRSSRRSVAV